MNISQFIARTGRKNEFKYLTKEQEQVADEYRERAKQVKVMRNSPGWKATSRYLQENISLMYEKFKVIDNEKDLFRLQAQIEAYENLLKFVDNTAHSVE